MVMKEPSSKSNCRGLTLLEALIVLAILVILGAMLLPRLSRGGKAKVPWCMSNLKQIDLGFIMFADDHLGRFPMQVSVTNGGTMEFIYSEHTFPHFQKLKSYRLDPQRFICPFETNRQAAASYEALNDLNLSYFLNADASTNNPSASVLMGDRFLQLLGQPTQPGLVVLTTNTYVSWTSNFHAQGGALAFADGHVEFKRSDKLNSFIQSLPFSTNRLCIP